MYYRGTAFTGMVAFRNIEPTAKKLLKSINRISAKTSRDENYMLSNQLIVNKRHIEVGDPNPSIGSKS